MSESRDSSLPGLFSFQNNNKDAGVEFVVAAAVACLQKAATKEHFLRKR
jgi:hypothetical protein